MSDDLDIDELLKVAGAEGRRRIPSVEPPQFHPSRPSRLPAVAAVILIVVLGVWFIRPSGSADQAVIVTTPSTVPPTSSSRPPTTVPVTPRPETVEVDFSAFVTGTERIDVSDIPRPETGESVTDPGFGTAVRRVTDAQPGESFVADIASGSAFNADESRFILRTQELGGTVTTGYWLYDAQTLAAAPLDLPTSSRQAIVWSPVDPNVLFFVEGTELIQLDVSTGSRTVAKAFDQCANLRLSSAPMAWNGDRVGLWCGLQTGAADIVVYQRSTDTVWSRRTDGLEPALVSPSGEFVMTIEPAAEGDTTVVLNRNLEPTGIDLPMLKRPVLSRTPDGIDVLIDVDFGGGSLAGNLVVYRLDSGTGVAIAGPNAGGFAYIPGLTSAAVPVVGGSGRVAVGGGALLGEALWGEVFLVDFTVETPEVARLAHHRLSAVGVEVDDLIVAMSPSGTKVLFHSDWNQGDQIDVYLIDLLEQ